MCMHRHQSSPFQSSIPNPRAGDPIYVNNRLVMVDGRVVYEPDTLLEPAYVVCLDCTKIADYDMATLTRSSQFRTTAPYVHVPYNPHLQLEHA
jgi:hypothetical protein